MPLDGGFFVSHTRAITDTPNRITVVQTEEEVDRAIEHLLCYDVLGFDVETWNSRQRHIAAFHPHDGARMRLSQWATPDGDAYVFDHYKISKTYLYRMFPNKSFLLVGQNLLFEMTFLMHELDIFEFGDIWDTMIAGQIINKGDVAGKESIPVALDKLALRELNIKLPKDEQASEWYKSELSQSQIKYAARDAQIVLPLWQVQRQKLIEQSQVRVSEIEFGIVPVCAWMKNNGIGLNGDRWTQQYYNVVEEIKAIQERLWILLGRQGTLFEAIPTMNLKSNKQLMDAFEFNNLPIPVDKDGNLTLSNKLLAQFEGYEAIQLYIKYVKLQKALSSFGLTWVEAINPVSGRMHGSLKLIGAETGRMAGAKPNLMQVKKEDEYRNCFEAKDGWVYVDTDYSQCELRILAEYSRDPKLLEAYDNDYDLHRFSASLIYKKTMETVTKLERGIAKNLNFGIVYGIGSAKFATDSQIPVEEGQKIMDYYLKEAYPRMGQWLDDRASAVFLNNLEARTMSGRVRRYRWNNRDKEIRAKIQRNAKNLPIQGTNADITKRAMRLLYDAVIPNRNKFEMILPIHDELLSEVRPDFAREGQYLQEKAMLQAEREFLKRVPCKVDTEVTRVWCKEPNDVQKAEAQELINQYV